MNTIKIMGKYQDKIYRDSMTGFTIFRFRPQLSANVNGKLRNGLINCRGYLASVDSNIPLELEGTWASDSYGWHFVVQNYEEKTWDRMITIDFLKSIKGIGDKTAEKIADSYTDFFEEIKQNGAANRLAMTTDLTLAKAESVTTYVRNYSIKRESMKFLFNHGGRMNHVEKLFSAYGVDGVEMLKKDPYGIGSQIGLPLKSCDSIAFKQNQSMKSVSRINAYTVEYMKKEMMSGNIYIKEGSMIKTIMKLLDAHNYNISSIDVGISIRSNPNLCIVKKHDSVLVYLKYLKMYEDKLAEHIMRLQSSGIETIYDDSYREYAENIAGFEFAPEQRAAFNLLRKTGIGILTGGPGTGKTTTVKGIIDAFEKMYPDKKIKLCAPTGRAAQRMTESTGRVSTTIHRLLEYKPFEGDPDRVNCKNELDPIDADFIIVDEVSMLDCQLASLFFAAVKAGTLVIMVGDINQLQSVGAGDVLNDMIRSHKIPVERLIKTYRQAEDSNIIKNATEINNGHNMLAVAEDFEIYKTENVSDMVVELVKKYHKTDDLFYAQILSPSHKGDGGVSDINYRLQKELNPGDGEVLHYGKNNSFKIHDKIIMMKNNLEKGYFNGDVGYVSKIENETMYVTIQDQEIQLSHSNLDDVKLAYSMTIHKSQGSEFPIVIISLPNSGMLKRNLLYTAVTRAKQKVIIVQQEGSIAVAVSKNEVGKRNTTLVQTLDELYAKRGFQ